MTPDERKKLEEELRLIEEANAQDSAEHARDLETINTIDTSSQSQNTQYTSMPSPGSLAGWNEDHSIDARQSGAYRDAKKSEESLKENQEKMDQENSTLGSIADSYGGVVDNAVDLTESMTGKINPGAVGNALVTGAALLEGGNQVVNSYKDTKATANQAALTKEAPTKPTGKGPGFSTGVNGTIYRLNDRPKDRFSYEEGSVRAQADKLKGFKEKLAKAGIDYEELKKRPGSMADKLDAEYNERLAKKYPSWGQRTLTGKAYGKMTGDGAGPTRKALISAGAKGLGVAAAIPGVYGLSDSFSTASEIEKAQEEHPALMEESKMFQREYKSVQLDFANKWISENKPSDVPPGVFEKRVATRALLQAQIDELSR